MTTNKQRLARLITRCFRCVPWSLLLVGDVSSLGINFDKPPETPWMWFTYAFAWMCIAFSVLGLAICALRWLIRLYQWAEDNE